MTEREQRSQEAQRLVGVGMFDWNLSTDEVWWSPVVYQLWGLPLTERPPAAADLGVHPEDRPAWEGALLAARSTGELQAEWRVVLPDGDVRWLSGTGRVEDGALDARRMLGMIQDVTARKEEERRLKQLLGELQHRGRNTLGVVRSLIARSIRSATDLDELAQHLDGRLTALARTHTVASRGAEAHLDLEDLIREELLSAATRDEQVRLNGPPILLRGGAADMLALAFHELTTNAVKFGCLCEPAGVLSVEWDLSETGGVPHLSLAWRESGVRALDLAPKRSGFGRELLEQALPYELNAATSMDFRRGGLEVLIALPLGDKISLARPGEGWLAS